jgi:hypothetical protein
MWPHYKFPKNVLYFSAVPNLSFVATTPPLVCGHLSYVANNCSPNCINNLFFVTKQSSDADMNKEICLCQQATTAAGKPSDKYQLMQLKTLSSTTDFFKNLP